MEGRDKPRKNVLRDGRGSSELKLARRLAFPGIHFLFSFGDDPRNLFGVPQQDRPFGA